MYCDSELAIAEPLLEWEAGRLYPLLLSFLQAAAQNKTPDPSLKSQLSALLTALGKPTLDNFQSGWRVSDPRLLSYYSPGPDLHPCKGWKYGFKKSIKKNDPKKI